MLTFSSFLVFACPEEDPESVGGPVTDGNNSSTTSGRSGNRLSGGISSSSSDGASVNSDCWGNVTAYGYPGPGWSWAGSFVWTFIGPGGGGGGNNAVVPSQAKLYYCQAKDDATALVSALPVTGSITTGYSIGQGSAGWMTAIINSGLRDIEVRVATGEPAPGSYSDGTVNWREASINWNLYNTWQQIPANPLPNNPGPVWNPTNSYPTQGNGGSKHIFAKWLLAKGQGSGNVSDMVGPDPEPSIDC